MQFNNLLKYNQKYRKDIDLAIARVIDSGHYILGNEVQCFEEEFSDYLGVEHVVGVGNGYDAIGLILKSMDLPLGSEVIVAANTYIATILPIINSGLVPVLVDADIKTLNIDLHKVEDKITDKTKVLLVTHLYGNVVDVPYAEEVTNKNNIMLVQDCAQAHGAKDSLGRFVGTTGYASAYSFYPTKNLGCIGDSGAVTLNNYGVASKIRALRNYGSVEKNINMYVGFNSRMDELQAAILRSKLPYLDDDNDVRRSYAFLYENLIINEKIVKPFFREERDQQVWHQYTILSDDRYELIKYLENKSIHVDIHYEIPPYRQTALEDYNLGCYEVSDVIHDKILSLPVSPEHTRDDVLYVCEAINEWKS